MLKKILPEIKKKNPKKIAIQLPEGLKSKAGEIIKELQTKTNAEIIVLADSCFGACDLRDTEAKELGCDLLLHFGHSSLNIREKVPTIYIEMFSDLDIEKVVKKAAREIPEKKIGIVTTVQHIHNLTKIKKILKKKNKKVFVGKPEGRAKYTGQILGCDFSVATSIAEKVDCFLYIGTGNFHPIGISVATAQKVYVADSEKDEVRSVEELEDKLIRQRFAKIERAKEAKKFGILLSLKKGQKRTKLANSMRDMLRNEGKEPYILTMNEITPEKLLGFRLDCYVSTACPRIAIDDSTLYDKPVLTPYELEIALGKRKWEDYKIDHF